MKQYLIYLCMLFIGAGLSAQVGINNPNPNVSAALDITSNNKGLLIPRIALIAENDATTISTPAVSLLIYNTSTVNGLSPGYYYNAGTTTVPVWKRLISDAADGSETKVTAGANIIITGNGTVASPYIVANASGTQNGQMRYWNGTTWVPVAPASYSGQTLYFVNNKPQWGPLVGLTDVMNPTTGKVWMDRNLGAIQVATSSIDGNAYGYLYQWGRGTDGHQIRTSGETGTLSASDNPGHSNFITSFNSPYDWRNPQNDNLWQGASGMNNPCPSSYRLPTASELDEERLSWTSNNAAGAFASPLKLPLAGLRDHSNGSLVTVGTVGYYWSSTVSVTYGRNLDFSSSIATMSLGNRGFGLSVRCLKDATLSGIIGALNCSGAVTNGNLISGVAASGVSSSMPYTGGNSGYHNGQEIISTGVTGLTATLDAGLFLNGAGNLLYTITGTPSSAGIASFVLNIGSQMCELNLTVNHSVPNCNPSNPTAIVDVINPATGKIWMDRNLGANRVASSSTDAESYGSLFQWGRGADGHQCVQRYTGDGVTTSGTTSTLSSTDTPGHDDFIIAANSPYDWRSPKNNNLWQGVNGVNNPCPTGYRLPTETEWEAERLSWSTNNAAGAFASPLKLPVAGGRLGNNGSLDGVGVGGGCWSSTVSGTIARGFFFGSPYAGMDNGNRGFGLSVRCIKN